MKCKSCNASIPEGSLTCPGCGKSIDELKNLGLIEEETLENVSVKPGYGTTQNDIQEVPSSNVNQVSAPVEDRGHVEKTNPPKNNGNNFLLPIIVLLLVIVGATASYLWYSSSKPKFIFESLIKSTYESAKENMNKNVKTARTNLSLKAKIDSKEENELYDLINKFDLNGTVDVDYEKGIMKIDLDTNYDKEELFKANLFYKGNKAYILLDGLFDKYISTDIEEINFESTTTEDAQYIVMSFLDALNKSLKDEYFTRTKQDDLTKTSLNLNNKVLKEISSSVLKQLKDDDKFLTSIANIYEKDKSEIKDSLEKALKEVEQMSSSNTNFGTLSIYTGKKPTDVKKIEFTIEGSDDYLLITIENGKYDIVINSEESGMIEFSIDNSSKDKYIFTCEVEGTKIEIEMDYSIKYNEKFDEPDVSNSVEFDKLTEQDMNTIEENVTKNNGLVKLIEDIQKVAELFGSSDDYDYDYNYDYDDDLGDYDFNW